jgi:Isopentenyldiphosphate isomerase
MPELWDIVDEYGNKTGRLHKRGTPMKKGEYHLSVSVWILNNKGEFLISKRTPTQIASNMWETTGGSAIASENSLVAALRETKEELGIILNAEKGRIFTKYTYPHSSGDGVAYFEVWIFVQEVDISTVVLQPTETCDVIWAGKEKIKQLIENGQFINYSYIDELFITASELINK